MLPSLLLLPLLAFGLTTATTSKTKESEMTEQAAISANMLRDETLAKRSPNPQAPPPAPGQPAPPGSALGVDFLTKNMITPPFLAMLFSPPPPAAGQDEKKKRSLRKRRERTRPKVYHQKSKSLGGTSLVHDGENVQRSTVNKAVES